MRRELDDEGLLVHISQSRMDQLLQRADADSNQLITYREFVRMVCHRRCNTFIAVVIVVFPMVVIRVCAVISTATVAVAAVLWLQGGGSCL